MRTIKTYFKGAPFYNALIGTWPPETRDFLGPSLNGKFIVPRAEEA
jgi:hypothetical protein